MFKSAITKKNLSENFLFSSSVAADVSHPKKSEKAYEWWYFDALSDDGREAIVIIFLDNFVFSPRYNSANNQPNPDFRMRNADLENAENRKENETTNPKSEICNPKSQCPAIAFTYYRNGKPVYRAINEFPAKEFQASEKKPECRIGENYFRFESAPYGSGYVISINAKLQKNRRLEAHFEWLSIESDFLPEKDINLENAHSWNLVVSRSDVSGKITVKEKNGKISDVVNFRGTGYHDHNLDNRWLPETVSDWQWGRAHFSDATAVFYRYKELDSKEPLTKLFVIRNNKFSDCDARLEENKFSRHYFGIRYPQKLHFETEDNWQLQVEQKKVIDASFFYLRFLSEITLSLPDSKPHQTIGITEHLAPKTLKYRWLDWLVNMRIGRGDKGSFLH
ncbi:MAG TPA: hypothetical protein VK892_09470 [Pyrinomonadaceae bacterium]|nr:hypothetical protein [Pyrinomonadaceae bacterium]